MNSRSQPLVVVGVDGSPGSVSATSLAAREAARLGARLRLVHVTPIFSALAPAPMMVLPPSELEEVGRSILSRAARQAGAEEPELAVDIELRHGVRSVELAEAAGDAALLVVGRDSRPTLERLLLGNTAAGAASRARCPVLSVPPDQDAHAEQGVVVVGVKSEAHVGELLADAFAAAAARRARLVVLHAWKLPSGYDDIIASRVSVQDANARCADRLRTLISTWTESYPDVDVEVCAKHDDAATALERAAEHADLLILIRRAHGVPAAMHLGSTARTVLRTASCPVRVVLPGTPVGDFPELVLEHAGRIDK